MWYNGPYVVEEYIQGNTKSYIPNPNYYDACLLYTSSTSRAKPC